jgi:hypothetical protein
LRSLRDPPLLERLGGELANFGIAALQRELRVPQLEGGADADEEGEIVELAAAAQFGGEEDAAAGIVGDFLGAAEAAAVARIMGERVALLLGEPAPLIVEIEQAQIIGVEAGEAGLGGMAGEDDRAGVGAPLDLLAVDNRMCMALKGDFVPKLGIRCHTQGGAGVNTLENGPETHAAVLCSFRGQACG